MTDTIVKSCIGKSVTSGKRYLRNHRALSMLEMVIAMAIIAVVFAALLPQFRNIQNSWDTKQARAETLQNGRILLDNLNRNLSTAVKIIDVSDPDIKNGFIEYEAADGSTYRYDLSGGAVRFGEIGNLSQLAGPVNLLQFVCYSLDDMDTPITDVDSIRFVNVKVNLSNSAALGKDESLETSVFLRTGSQSSGITSINPIQLSASAGIQSDLCQIDANHILCVYSDVFDGQAVILAVDRSDWKIIKSTYFRFENDFASFPSLAQIDDTHYLCVYTGPDSHGWGAVLTVDKTDWTITKESSFEFDTKMGRQPTLAAIDENHYLCAYTGKDYDGWALVLTVDTDNWTVANETPFEFDSGTGLNPSLSKVDDEHYLCAYTGNGFDGWATVLTVDLGDWKITKETPFEFDWSTGLNPTLAKIDEKHHLCAYQGPSGDGWAAVLEVNTGTWKINRKTPFEFDPVQGKKPALCRMKNNDFLCVYKGTGFFVYKAMAVVLRVDNGISKITRTTDPYEYGESVLDGDSASLCTLDTSHALCTYGGRGWRGQATVLATGSGFAP